MSHKVYVELIEAGAPKLPEGWFYRVHGWDRDGDMHVEILRRADGLNVHVATGFSSTCPWPRSVKSYVAQACRRAYKDATRQTRWARREDELARFKGDHP